MINQFNDEYLPKLIKENSRVDEAMNYALLGGGKRVRPNLLFAMLEDLHEDVIKSFPIGAGIEMIHTYSLIHDDLPAMDNDELRRGRKTVHIAFDEATAILAGDGLLTKAFEMVANSDYSADIKSDIVRQFALMAGHQGMILGQTLDISYENLDNVTFEMLKEMDDYKTGCLLTLPMICALIIAGKTEYLETIRSIGFNLGLAFQIQDDILDYTATAEQLGKSTSDKDNNKSTYYTLLGYDKANEVVNNLFSTIKQNLDSLPENFTETKHILDILKGRNR